MRYFSSQVFGVILGFFMGFALLVSAQSLSENISDPLIDEVLSVSQVFSSDSVIKEVLASTTPDMSTALLISRASRDTSTINHRLDRIIYLLTRIYEIEKSK